MSKSVLIWLKHANVYEGMKVLFVINYVYCKAGYIWASENLK
jgi:hypothetical protein